MYCNGHNHRVGQYRNLECTGCDASKASSDPPTSGSDVAPSRTLFTLFGAQCAALGVICRPQRTVCHPQGTVYHPHGTICRPRGANLPPSGRHVSPSGRNVPPLGCNAPQSGRYLLPQRVSAALTELSAALRTQFAALISQQVTSLPPVKRLKWPDFRFAFDRWLRP